MDPDEPKRKKFKLLMKASITEMYDISKDWMNGEKFAVCRMCSDQRAIKMTNSNTSGLHRHLKSHHSKIYEGILNECHGEVQFINFLKFRSNLSSKSLSFCLISRSFANCHHV